MHFCTVVYKGSMYDWNDIRYFLELSRTGRLSQAAQRLGVDHTTVSRRITALEKSLEVRLFDRTPKGYALTEEGRSMVAHSEAMESNSLALFRELSGRDAAMSGTVRLATPEALGSQFLARRWTSFRQSHPAIELELVAETRHLSLSKREADIAILLARPKRGRLVAFKSASYNLRLYASQSYLNSRTPIHRLRDVTGHDFIWYVDDLLQLSELQLLDKTFKSPHVAFRSTNVTGQANAAADGLGLALLPCFLADQMSELVPILPERISIERELWIAAHEDLRNVARIDAVIRFLSALFKKEQKMLSGK